MTTILLSIAAVVGVIAVLVSGIFVLALLGAERPPEDY